MKTTIKTLLFSLLMASIFLACKKKSIEEDGPKDVLYGNWHEARNGSNSLRTLSFGTGGKFSMKLTDSIGAATFGTLNGNYVLKGDSIQVRILESVDNANGKQVKTAVDYKIFDYAVIKFTNQTKIQMDIDYITYPADGPVPTHARFNKILAID